VTAVSNLRATRDERRRAYARDEAVRLAHALDGTLVPAIATGTVLLLRGWGWDRAREWSPLAPPEAPSPGRPVGLRALELVLRERGTGRPLAGVPLDVAVPGGDERRVTTDSAGWARLDGLPPGVCELRSAIEEARVETSYVADAGETGAGIGPPLRGAHLVQVERHRVRTGECPDDVGAAHEVPWELIARFNWGTTDGEALEASYRETLGSRSGPDGQVRFDDDDDPGLLLVPRPWTARLAVGAAHELVVAPLRPLFLRLENDAGLVLPAARYQARFADGTERTGSLGGRGIARLDGVPDGPFTVAYPDEEDLLAASLAASVRRALAEGETAPLFTLLMQSPEVVARAAALYARHFDDLTGHGLGADIDQVVTDPEARRPLLGLCALAGLKVEGVESVAVATSRRRGAS
jgi:hypothetical protein